MFGFINWHFLLGSRQEVREALEILNEASLSFELASFLQAKIRKNILAHSKEFVENLNKDGRSVRKHVYSMIANTAGDLVESGQYHLYRGVLNPMGPGQDLLRVFDSAMEELVRLGDESEEFLKEQKKSVRKNIQKVG